MNKIFATILLFLFFGSCQLIYAQDLTAKIRNLVGAYAKLDMFNGSVLVAKKDTLILSEGFGKANFEKGELHTPDTKFCIASLNKQFTAVLILQLLEKGKLKLNVPISRYLPWYRKELGDQITIHQLLSHTAGLGEYSEKPDFFEVAAKRKYTHREFVKLFCSDALVSKPGTNYRYTNTAYYLLGTIIEEITGRSYREVLQEQILDVVGMKNSGMAELNQSDLTASGYTYQLGKYQPIDTLQLYATIFSAGGMYSTVKDLHLWDRALYGNLLLTDSSKALLFQPVMANYAYGFGVVNHFVFHQGAIHGFRALITRTTDEQEVIILLSNNFDNDPNALNNGIYAILHHDNYQMPKQPIVMALGKKINSAGTKKAVAFFKSAYLAKDSTYNYEGAEAGLNTLGYYLANHARLRDALEVFRLNTETFPKSANAFDSYAENLLKAGKKKEALENYRKVLAIDPDNGNAKRQIKKIQGG